MRRTILAVFALALWLVADSPGQDNGKKKGGKGEKSQQLRVVLVAHKSLEQWIEEIKDRDRGKSENAIRTLMFFGQDQAQKAIPALVAEMKKPPPVDTSIRVNVPIALGLILRGNKGANPRDVD